MAGDWIKMRYALSSDPKVIAIVKYLEKTPAFINWIMCGNESSRYVSDVALRYAVTGALHNAWCNANEHAENDVIKDAGLDWLDSVTGVPNFGLAMEKVGWALVDGDDLILPKFNSNNTSGAERQKKYREKKRNVSDVTRDVTRDNKVTPEKRREEKRIISKDIIIPSDKPTKTKTLKPTIEEVSEFCRNRSNGIDAEHFIAHYDANGWRTKTGPIKDWRAAVITWEKNSKRFGNGKPPQKTLDEMYPDVTDEARRQVADKKAREEARQKSRGQTA